MDLRDRVYRRALSRTLQQAIERTRRRLAIVTGSCGLQMANTAWPRLIVPSRLDVHVLALGPVCLGPLKLPGARVTILQGGRDYWSRAFYRGRVDVRVPCGHLEYWSDARVREHAAAILSTPG